MTAVVLSAPLSVLHGVGHKEVKLTKKKMVVTLNQAGTTRCRSRGLFCQMTLSSGGGGGQCRSVHVGQGRGGCHPGEMCAGIGFEKSYSG